MGDEKRRRAADMRLLEDAVREERYDDAIEIGRSLLQSNPLHRPAIALLVAALVETGNVEEAQRCIQRYAQLQHAHLRHEISA
jgi:DNA-binding SARP family transcriptional activator